MKLFSYKGCVNSAAYVAPLMFSWPSPSKIAQVVCLSLAGSLLVGCGGSDSKSDDSAKYPVITLNGDAEMSLAYGEDYVEPGATVSDDVDLDLELTITGDVDSSVLTDYTITYSATDSGGRTTTVERIVSVVDVTAPVITLALNKAGEEAIELGQGRDYNELGATVTDDLDSTVEVVIDNSSVDVDTLGSYTVSYTATDSYGNVGSASRTVTVVEKRPFITTWKTDNDGFSADDQIQLAVNPDYEGLYTFTVDWGDGETTTETGTTTHTYSEAGTYTVSISGDYPGLYNGVPAGNYDAQKILTVEQWGDVPLQSMFASFLYAENLTSSATDTPDLRLVETLSHVFYGTSHFNHDVSDWNVNNITDISSAFAYTTSFNQDISAWDISSVTTLNSMFRNATAFNQDLSSWDTTNVESLYFIFNGASSFDQDLSSWNVVKVISFGGAFENVTLSTENYDALLNSWSEQTTETKADFDGGCSEYSDAAQVAHDYLTGTLAWDITYTCDE